jgi:hypothetical protein
LLHILEGTDLKDVEKEIEKLQQSLISWRKYKRIIRTRIHRES